MIPEVVDELVVETPMPPGYHLKVKVQRPFMYRGLWRVRVLDDDGNRLYGFAYYPSALLDGIVAAKRWAWARAWVTGRSGDPE